MFVHLINAHRALIRWTSAKLLISMHLGASLLDTGIVIHDSRFDSSSSLYLFAFDVVHQGGWLERLPVESLTRSNQDATITVNCCWGSLSLHTSEVNWSINSTDFVKFAPALSRYFEGSCDSRWDLGAPYNFLISGNGFQRWNSFIQCYFCSYKLTILSIDFLLFIKFRINLKHFIWMFNELWRQ